MGVQQPEPRRSWRTSRRAKPGCGLTAGCCVEAPKHKLLALFTSSAAEYGQNSTGRVLASSRVGRPPVKRWVGPVRMGKGASLTETEGDWLSVASGPKAPRPLVKVPWKAGSKVNSCPFLQL